MNDGPERPRRPMTSRQLAALIGVSQAAVSRAFTPGSSISPALRERILRGAREFGYQPNAIASMLTTRRTNIVGLVVSDMSNPFHPAMVERLTRGLQRLGLQSLLFNVTPGARVEDQLIAIRTYNVDAVVVLSATVLGERDLAWAVEGRRAVVLNRLTTQEITTICCDTGLGMAALVDHLEALGRRRIGYVAGLTRSAIGVERHRALTTRLAERGMRLTGIASYESHSYEAGWKGALDLVPGRPDAILFATDILALGGMDALREAAGLSIPGDIAVAGFDDIAPAGWPHYGLTTYRQPVDRMVELTLGRLTAEPAPPVVHLTVAGELVVRGSTRPAGDARVAAPRAPDGPG